MLYEFTTKDGKAPKREDVPTRLSVKNQLYKVDRDHCVEAPSSLSAEFAQHGFKPRTRPSLTIESPVVESEPPLKAKAEAESPLELEDAADMRQEEEPEQQQVKEVREDPPEQDDEAEKDEQPQQPSGQGRPRARR